MPRPFSPASVASRFVALLLGSCLTFSPNFTLLANPVDPEVIHGAVEFSEDFSDLLEITQHSNRAVIHWEGFSIDASEITRFIQPNADSATLNRVISGDASSILGTLEANGKLLLINPNGILFGAGAQVDTNGFIASTLNVPDVEFLAGGDLRFSGASQAPVVNLGEITAADGDVFLVGATVQNDGTISAPNGTVGLAAGQQVLITAQGDERVFVEVGSAGSVEHNGAITAAQAELKAAGGNPKAMAVNVAGSVEATGVERVGGRVLLSAGGGGVKVSDRVRAQEINASGAEVEIDANGNLDASGPQAGEVEIAATNKARVIGGRIAAKSSDGTGGVVRVNSDSIAIGAGSRVFADGTTSGGEIFVSSRVLSVGEGAEIKANASIDGAGGLVMATAAESASIGGTLAAHGRGTGSGGFVNVLGGDLTLKQTSRLDATGAADGGFVTVDASGDVAAHGRIGARGQIGNGGFILVKSAGNLLVGANARLDAGGEIDGGFVSVEGENDIAVHGQLLARGRTGNGGQIFVTGDGDVAIGATAFLDASGEVDGGLIQVDGGGDVAVDGQLKARGASGNGGQILVSGDGDVSVGETGVLDASGGGDGGFVSVEGGGEVTVGGRLDASGGSGAGGMISVTGDAGVTIGQTADLDASGAAGGTIFVDSANGDTEVNGALRAVGNDGAGGHIEVTGENVLLGSSAAVDASGLTGGGRVLIGGDFQGANPDVHNAQTTTIERGATISADAFGAGNAGEIIFWADGDTFFGGHASTAARSAAAGDGGFIEVSGKQNLAYRGTVDLSSIAGIAGELLLDPDRVIIIAGPQGGAANSGAIAGGTILATDGGPEIDVQGNNTSIVTGDTTPNTGDHT
ncbi:MAG: filamentous hemagglutinin N-terminal domain-containing protein, partial [Verrucomicrobiota bacterium]